MRNRLWTPEHTNRKPSFNDMGAMRLNPDYFGNQGLVLSILMNEGAGLRAHDVSGKGNHGTLVNGPTWDYGKLGQALKFDGSSGYILLPAGSRPVVSAGTISLWFKSGGNAESTRHLLYSYNDANGQSIEIYLFEWNPTVIRVKHESGWTENLLNVTVNSWTSSQSVWHFLTFSWSVSGSVMATLYDGTYQSASKTLGTSSYTTGNIKIGAYAPSNQYYFLGGIDDVRVYNRALTPAEVMSLYLNPFGTPDSPRFLVLPRRTWFVPSEGGVTRPDSPNRLTATGRLPAINRLPANRSSI